MHNSSRLNREGKQKVEKPVTASFFSAFLNWRCASNSLEDDFIHPTLISPSSTVQSEISCISQNDQSRRQDDAMNQFRFSGHHNGDRSPPKPSLKADSRNSGSQSHFTENSHKQEKSISNATLRMGKTVSSSKNFSQTNSVSLKKVNVIALCCDKCDGKHDTDSCPHYKKKRESHLDGQKNGWKLVGGSSNLPGKFLTSFFDYYLPQRQGWMLRRTNWCLRDRTIFDICSYPWTFLSH